MQSGFMPATAGMQCVNAIFESVEAWQMRKDLLALRSTEAVEDTLRKFPSAASAKRKLLQFF